jgi:FkbM family methyltransferase
MTVNSYAQNFEDVLLWRALGHVPQGRYLDIGAQDPENDSVSLAFYEQGWRGIHVEPTPTYAQKIRQQRPDETVIEAAVASSGGPIRFFEIAETGLSTGVGGIAEQHQREGFANHETLVPTVRLSGLLDQADLFHWMKIDVEGMEGDVLASWDDHPARPWIVIVEATLPNSQEESDGLWRHELEGRQYTEVHFDGLSRYFLHETQGDLAKAFRTPPNVFDAFTIAITHFAARELRQVQARLQQELNEARARTRTVEEDAASLRHQLAERVHEVEQVNGQVREFEQRLLAADEAARNALNSLHGETIALRVELGRAEERAASASAETQRFREELQQALARWPEQERVWLDRLADHHERSRSEVEDHRQQAASLQVELAQLREAHAAQSRQADGDRQRHAQASEAITRVLMREPSRWQRFGELLGVASDKEARKALQAWTSLPTGEGAHRFISEAWPSRAVEDRSPYHRADSLQDLLGWEDIDFVRCAYVTILGRQPDAAGEQHYVLEVRRGLPKLDIIWQLRQSREARSHDPGIAGLDAELRRARRARLPVIGSLFPDSRLESQRPRVRALRATANRVLRTSAEVSALAAPLSALQEQVSSLAAKQEEFIQARDRPVTIEQINSAFEFPLRG